MAEPRRKSRVLLQVAACLARVRRCQHAAASERQPEPHWCCRLRLPLGGPRHGHWHHDSRLGSSPPGLPAWPGVVSPSLSRLKSLRVCTRVRAALSHPGAGPGPGPGLAQGPRLRVGACGSHPPQCHSPPSRRRRAESHESGQVRSGQAETAAAPGRRGVTNCRFTQRPTV
jgi:hypothetical protein